MEQSKGTASQKEADETASISSSDTSDGVGMIKETELLSQEELENGEHYNYA